MKNCLFPGAFIRIMFVSALLFCGSRAFAQSGFSTVHFLTDSTFSLSTCANIDSFSLDSSLTVQDDGGIPSDPNHIFWYTLLAPHHGTLIMPPTVTSIGGHRMPSGGWYIHTAGFTGLDTFAILVTSDYGDTDQRFYVVDVHPLPSVSVSGSDTICAPGAYSYTGAPSGGIWGVSSVSVATVNAAGVMNGLSTGRDTLIYRYTDIYCCSQSAIKPVDIIALPAPGIINGSDSVCFGATGALTHTATGGIWMSSNPAIASVSTTGIVTGTGAGAVTIWYIVSGYCGSDTARFPLTVYHCGLGTTALQQSVLQPEIFPNPGRGSFTIKLPAETNGAADVTVTDVQGRTFFSSRAFSGKDLPFRLDAPAGIYFVRITHSETNYVLRLIIE